MIAADKGGCGLYRIMMPGRVMKALNLHDVTISHDLGHARIDIAGNVTGLQRLDYDVVVYQRPIRRPIVQSIPLVQEQGITVVVELDDDLERVDPDNIAYTRIHPAMNPVENWHHLKTACAAADLLTVSTPALLRYAHPGQRAVVIPNVIPASVLTQQRMWRPGGTEDRPLIGWTGTLATHPRDLAATRGALGQVIDRTDARFLLIGDPAGAAAAVGCDPSRLLCTGWVPPDRYIGALAAIDIGVVPLADTAFNASKSALKGLEMSALGIPFVASPTPEYQRLADEHGIGLLARSRRDWQRHLHRLINDPAERHALGAAYRQRVAASLTLEGNIHRWADAYREARAATKRRDRTVPATA